MTKTLHVVGAAIIENGKMLAAQRAQGRSLGGLWEFPGGKIEPGESVDAAILRELQEEFGAKAEVTGHVAGMFSYEYDFGIVELQIAYVKLLSPIVKTIAHDELRWVTPTEASQLEWPPADVTPIKHLIETDFNSL